MTTDPQGLATLIIYIAAVALYFILLVTHVARSAKKENNDEQ